MHPSILERRSWKMIQLYMRLKDADRTDIDAVICDFDSEAALDEVMIVVKAVKPTYASISNRDGVYTVIGTLYPIGTR